MFLNDIFNFNNITIDPDVVIWCHAFIDIGIVHSVTQLIDSFVSDRIIRYLHHLMQSFRFVEGGLLITKTDWPVSKIQIENKTNPDTKQQFRNIIRFKWYNKSKCSIYTEIAISFYWEIGGWGG